MDGEAPVLVFDTKFIRHRRGGVRRVAGIERKNAGITRTVMGNIPEFQIIAHID